MTKNVKALTRKRLEKAEELVERAGLSRSRYEILADDVKHDGVLKMV